MPVKLTTDALQPTLPASHQLIGLWSGEVHMDSGHFLGIQLLGEPIEQRCRRLDIAEQTLACDRCEGYGAQQLGVIADAGALAGIRPGPVEHVFAVGMALAIQRQCGPQPPLRIAQQTMGRLPATATADAAAVLERTEKRVTQKGLRIGQQGIPFGGIEFGEALYGLDRHGRSLACRADEKKPRQGGAQMEHHG